MRPAPTGAAGTAPLSAGEPVRAEPVRAELVRAELVRAELGPGVSAGFSTTAGGCSVGAWAGLNLALHVGDDPAAVRANRAALSRLTGAPVAFVEQVHGTQVLVATEPASSPADSLGVADALVASGPGVPVAVLVADCVPVLLADPVNGVLAAAHAGRVGLLDGVLARTVETMLALGARRQSLRGVLGPCAGPCCYEVPEAMAERAERRLPGVAARTRWGTPSLDLPSGARASLRAAGVHRVDALARCTIESGDLFSYRRTPVTGRFAGLVWFS